MQWKRTQLSNPGQKTFVSIQKMLYFTVVEHDISPSVTQFLFSNQRYIYKKEAEVVGGGKKKERRKKPDSPHT